MQAADVPRLLPLNNAHAVELSMLDAARFEDMRGTAFCALCTPDDGAFMLSFDQDAAYDGRNFLWFKRRYPRFVYVDRIVVAPSSRGRGLAREIYGVLFARARDAGHSLVACEVNSSPPNPASDAFHAALGFRAVGEAVLDATKAVRYLICSIGDDARSA